MVLHPQPNTSPNHNTNNKIEIQLDTKSKHKPQAMPLGPCHMLHSLPSNKHVMIQGIQGFKKTWYPKKTHEFWKKRKYIFIINVHSTLWIMQGTPTNKE
jgi:hypothetical protein